MRPIAATPPAARMILRSPGSPPRNNNPAVAVPTAMTGTSGPTTAPNTSVASAARTTDVIMRGVMLKAMSSRGRWPPCPGSRHAAQVIAAPSSSIPTTHHHGADDQPKASGIVVQMAFCSTFMAVINSTDARMPTTAATIINRPTRTFAASAFACGTVELDMCGSHSRSGLNVAAKKAYRPGS